MPRVLPVPERPCDRLPPLEPILWRSPVYPLPLSAGYAAALSSALNCAILKLMPPDFLLACSDAYNCFMASYICCVLWPGWAAPGAALVDFDF